MPEITTKSDELIASLKHLQADIQRAKSAHLPTTLRDHFAIAALPQILRIWAESCEYKSSELAKVVAKNAYIIADAMMEERGEL